MSDYHLIVTTKHEVGLRERKRQVAMKRIQRIAIDRFLAAGFAGATVEEIAAEADVSPVTIYRYFGTKEGLVLWDEFDPPILAEIDRRLRTDPPLRAVRDALVTLLDVVYDAERHLVLDRSRLIHKEPALLAAALFDSQRFKTAIAASYRSVTDEYSADVLASAAVGALITAVDHWQRRDGKVPLAHLIAQGFDTLDQT
ncbi:TetR family transcriptional regulator [soil metagenome]